MNANILEIFRSIQGEGPYAGTTQVFVRFFECNMHCVWCDTPHSIGDDPKDAGRYKTREVKDIFDEVAALYSGCHSVSLTGGEPLMQPKAVKELAALLKERGMTTYLETNGTLPEALGEVIEHIDIVAMDIKLPSSTQCRPFWEEHAAFLKTALAKEVFIKAVISSDTAKEDVEKLAELVNNIDPNVAVILQPNYFQIRNGAIDRCLRFYELCHPRLGNVRVLPQVHKIMKLR